MESEPLGLLPYFGPVRRIHHSRIERILQDRPHPEMGYRAVLGLMRLSREHGPLRLEAACERALAIGSPRYKSVASILATKLDAAPLANSVDTDTAQWSSTAHAHLRGPGYYH